MTIELDFQRDVDKVATALGWRKFALPSVQRAKVRGTQWSKGWPDRVYFRRGRVVVLEMKPEKGRDTTPEQDVWLDEWAMVAKDVPGMVVRVVRPSDMPQIEAWLR